MTDATKIERLKQQKAEIERKLAAEQAKLKERDKRDRDAKLAIIGAYFMRERPDLDADLRGGKMTSGFYRWLTPARAKVLGIDLPKILADLDKQAAEIAAKRAGATQTPVEAPQASQAGVVSHQQQKAAVAPSASPQKPAQQAAPAGGGVLGRIFR